jgi:outer membrane protein
MLIQMKKFFTTLLFSVCLILGTQAQPMDLKQCIEYAWQNNLDIKQAILNQRNAEIDAKQSKTNLLPTLSANAGQHYQFGRTIDRFTNTFVNQTIRSNNFGLNAGISVFNGFQMHHNIKQQASLEKASIENYENIKNQVALNVASAFLQVIQSSELIKNAESQLASTLESVNRTQKLVDAGVSDRSVLLVQKAQLASEKLNLVNAQSTYQNALIALKLLMQMPFQQELSLLIPDVQKTEMYQVVTVNDLYTMAEKKMPQIKQAELQLQASEYQTKMSRSLLSPNISLYGSVSTVFSENAKSITDVKVTGTQVIGVTQTSNENVLQPVFAYQTQTIGFSKQLRDNIGQSAGLSLSWNLFNGFQVQNQIQKAKINQDINQINLARVQNSLMNEISLAVNNFNMSQQRLKASEENLEAQTLSLEFIQKRFDAGAGNSFELIQSKNNYNIALSNQIQAKYELVFRWLVLEFYKGNPIIL